MEISSLTLVELRRLQAKIEKEIRQRSNSARKDLLKKMQKMAADEGLSLSDIVSGAPASEEKQSPVKRKTKAGKKKTGPVPVKYRNPENPAIGWSGRGRKPQWVVDWLAQDKPIEGLLVNQG